MTASGQKQVAFKVVLNCSYFQKAFVPKHFIPFLSVCFYEFLFTFISSSLSFIETIVEFEENRWEPRKWQQLIRIPGNVTTAVLPLAPYVNYQFRLVSVNGVGRSRPSEPSERYETPPAGMHCYLSLVYLLCIIHVAF